MQSSREKLDLRLHPIYARMDKNSKNWKRTLIKDCGFGEMLIHTCCPTANCISNKQQLRSF